MSPGPQEKGGSGGFEKGLSERGMFIFSVLSYVYNPLVTCLLKIIYCFGQVFFSFFLSLRSTQVDHLTLCALGDTMSRRGVGRSLYCSSDFPKSLPKKV